MGRLESERQGNDAQGVGTMMNCSDCDANTVNCRSIPGLQSKHWSKPILREKSKCIVLAGV
jgi:hypothetical protein